MVPSAMRSRFVPFLQVTLTIALLAATALEGQTETANLKKVEFDEASLEDIIAFFRSGPGSSGKSKNILVDPKLSTQEIKVTLTLYDISRGVAFAYAAEIAGFDYREEKYALRIFPRRGNKPSVKGFLTRGGPMTARRASEIKMPKVEFDATELAEVISDISSASRQLDPKKKGLNIILSRGVDPSTPVTLSLQNVPVSTVLNYVAEFARLGLRADGSAIVFTPRKKVGQKEPSE